MSNILLKLGKGAGVVGHEKIGVEEILQAGQKLSKVIRKTPLQKNEVLSQMYDCNFFLKREDLQDVRSFKIRGAYYKIQGLSEAERAKGVVCASGGNHAQGVAYSCKALGIQGYIYMPNTTPRQKVQQVKLFGGEYVEVRLTGDTFDDAFHQAKQFCDEHTMIFVHPFDDPMTIAGQGTVAMEIMNEIVEPIDYVFMTIGGGGLAAGVSTYIKTLSPSTKIIGVEPAGAPAMSESIQQGEIVSLDTIERFIDGAAIKRVGNLTYEICRKYVDDVVAVPEGKVCTAILELYNHSAIVVEPAGALPIAALDQYKQEIEGKNVVCILSGGNNDIERMQEIQERSLIFEGLKHYFIVNFPQRAGALREFLDEVLGPNDDITRFEYTKKNNRDNGPALVGVEVKKKEDFDALIERMGEKKITYIDVNNDPDLFNLLI